MKIKPETVIDDELCIGCGLCIKVCPSETISIQNKKARVTGDESMHCGHCAAICPEGAISVTSLDEHYSRYHTFHTNTSWVDYGKPDTGGLVNLMASRRSCRNFNQEPVPEAILEDLVKIGTTAPSGTNCQLWAFTIIPRREDMEIFAGYVMDFFQELNRKAEKPWLRKLLKLIGNPGLNDYYQNYYESVSEAIEQWEIHGTDRLFHGAVSAILVGCDKEASCPQEDAILATQNILLGAHSMGLGSCLIGFAVEAAKHKPAIKHKLGLPHSENLYSVIALGYPDETYKRVSGRKKIKPRYFRNGVRS